MPDEEKEKSTDVDKVSEDKMSVSEKALLAQLRETRQEAKDRRLENQRLSERLKMLEEADAKHLAAEKEKQTSEETQKKAEEAKKKAEDEAKQDLEKLSLAERFEKQWVVQQRMMEESQKVLTTKIAEAVSKLDDQHKTLERGAKAEALANALKGYAWHDEEIARAMIGVDAVPMRDGIPDKEVLAAKIAELAAKSPFLIKQKVDIQNFGATQSPSPFFPTVNPDDETEKKARELVDSGIKAGVPDTIVAGVTMKIQEAIRNPLKYLRRGAPEK